VLHRGASVGDTVPVKLSVALVTMERPDSLALCLESLRAQSYQPHEVIISDDSRSEYCPEVKALAERWQCKYIVGPRKGLYANRNHVALACTGTHIRTMDDDHRLPEGHLRKCLDAIESDPNSLWTVGEKGYLNGKLYATLSTANQLHPSGLGHPVFNLDDNWAIADGSTIYPAKIFKLGHRMVEWYGYGPSYLEFGAYLYKQGFKSRCIPGTVVEHYASDATINRMKSLPAIESRLFSSLCFNLYFKPNKYLALKYMIACLVDAQFDPKLIKAVPLTLRRIRQRWS